VRFPAVDGLRPITFILRQKPHRYLRRQGDDLVYTCRLTDAQAAKGVRLKIPLLREGELIEMSTVAAEAYTDLEKSLPKLGMPTKKGGRGALRVRFRVVPGGKVPG
jgi:DnaJ-class molecular chaperone